MLCLKIQGKKGTIVFVKKSTFKIITKGNSLYSLHNANARDSSLHYVAFLF